jgi:F1F0 ATPase subunit 2
MTGLQSTAPALFALQAVAWLCGGALIGVAYFQTLRWNVRLLTLGRIPLLAAGLQAGRFLLLAGLFASVAQRWGALPLLSAATGIVTARTIMTARLGAAA